MSKLIDYFFTVFIIVWWLAGFSIASGFWQTLFCWFPFYAMYLVVDFFIKNLF